MEPTSTVQTSALSLRVQAPDGTQHTGSLVQFTGGTMTAHFWGDDLPSLGLGLALQIQLQGLSLELPMLPASPLERSELPGGRSYRFGFTLTEDFLNRIPKHLQALFPFRALHRVKPLEDEPITLQIAGEEQGDWFHAEIKDLSSAGLGVLVDLETEQALCQEQRIRMHIAIPCMGDDVTSKITAIPQHRHLEGQKVHWGMAIDNHASGEWADAEALGKYIIKREQHVA